MSVFQLSCFFIIVITPALRYSMNFHIHLNSKHFDSACTRARLLSPSWRAPPADRLRAGSGAANCSAFRSSTMRTRPADRVQYCMGRSLARDAVNSSAHRPIPMMNNSHVFSNDKIQFILDSSSSVTFAYFFPRTIWKLVFSTLFY